MTDEQLTHCRTLPEYEGAKILAASNGWDFDTSSDTSAQIHMLEVARQVQAAAKEPNNAR